MRKPRILFATILTTFLAMPAVSQAAATLDVQAGRLLGAFNIPVNGMLFDVRFKDLSCIDEFDGCDDEDDFAADTAADALALAQSLLDHVFLNGGLGTFDDDPELSFGCGNLEFCQFGVPYAIDGPNVLVAIARNDDDEIQDDVVLSFAFPRNLSLGNDTNIFNTATWAVFTKQTQVSEPGTFAVFGLGLVGLGMVRRRRTVK